MKKQLIMACLVLPPAWGWQTYASSLDARLSAPRDNYSLSANGEIDGLLKAADAFRIPLGIEWIKVTDAEPKFVRSWQQTTPLAILRDIVKAYPGYELEVGVAVVHVFPAAMRGDRGDVLNFRLESGEINAPINMAAVSLSGKVKPLMTPARPNEPTFGLGVNTLEDGNARPISVALGHATVREVLDNMCLESGRGAWLVAYPPVPSRTRAGFLKTVRLENSEVVDDARFFPSWRFLHWGEVPAIHD